ncbi:MAG: UDP-3-O-(3-hydroxymyristoyl)glucosamine N-acyltransferase [Xanthomonadales bacterium]
MASTRNTHRLDDLAARFGLELRGDPDATIDGVGTLRGAGPSQVSFLANRAYRKELAATRAGAVIVQADDAAACPTHCLIAADPYLAYARIAVLFDPRPAAEPGIHPTAAVAASAQIGDNVSIGAHAVIGDDCVIDDGCSVGPGSVLEAGCELGAGCRLHANVSLGHGVRLGRRVIVHPGAVIGADGFGIAFAGDHWEKVPQLGSVTIGDDCEIGANTCIDRGAIEDTVLEEDVRLDNLCQIAHNVRIGAHTAMAGAAGVAGSSHVGRYCLIGGAAGITGHIEVADRTTIAAKSAVLRSITEPGLTWSGTVAAQPVRSWQKNLARLLKLDELARQVRQLEKNPGKSENHD